MEPAEVVTTALAENIRELFTTLDQTPSLIEESLASLRRDLKLAVRSSVGLTLTVVMHPDQPITLTSIDHFTDVSDLITSMRLPMNWAAIEAGSKIIFYAGLPGAFVDLAADLTYSLHLAPGTIVLDEDTSLPGSESGLSGAAESSTVNQAIGVLIDRGYTPTTAGAHLKRQAGEMMLDLHHAATRVLQSAAASVKRLS
ncbi:MAG TPA: hypothetical protein VLJ88_12590 [Propionibacteriaceae bacterium]|nr:hypothetical protein [Propionibacteriaceae bacterium]